ncbi:MAG: hypothetical protein A2X78_04445 [Gammaproteobacteria bacterium GWE2_37_16]|nr:MAG: hypothetical protein A2X78_04445 [Gammaproteobacteria bacterium GWE2_37_16]
MGHKKQKNLNYHLDRKSQKTVKRVQNIHADLLAKGGSAREVGLSTFHWDRLSQHPFVMTLLLFSFVASVYGNRHAAISGTQNSPIMFFNPREDGSVLACFDSGTGVENAYIYGDLLATDPNGISSFLGKYGKAFGCSDKAMSAEELVACLDKGTHFGAAVTSGGKAAVIPLVRKVSYAECEAEMDKRSWMFKR